MQFRQLTRQPSTGKIFLMAHFKGANRQLSIISKAAKLICLISLFAVIFPLYPSPVSAGTVKWSEFNIPAEGQAGSWVLADGADVQLLKAAPDGTLYAYVSGLTYTLYRSMDGGGTWSYIGNVQDEIIDIAISPRNPDTIYYATDSSVYRSNNGGQNFSSMSGPGSAGSNNITITSMTVAWLNRNLVFIGTRDTDNTEFGGVYCLDEETLIPHWTDTEIGNYDVYALTASPNYATDLQITALANDETDSVVITKTGDAGWGNIIGNARLNRNNSPTHSPVAAINSASIAFPADYDGDASSGNCIRFIAINSGTGEGDAFKITGAEVPDQSLATDLNIAAEYGLNDLDITSLAIRGVPPEANLIAGAADSTQVYFSRDSGTSWAKSRKLPTGETNTRVFIPPYLEESKVYAATSGDESAFSISADYGDTWNQLSLIDTSLSDISDLAPSPNYSLDNTLFMLTFGGTHSLWRSLDGGSRWERIFSGAHSNVDNLNLVKLPPQYGGQNTVVFLAGESGGKQAIWESGNNGQTFRRYFTGDPVTGDNFDINAWTAVNNTTLFISGYNGSDATIYATTNRGVSYSQGASAGSNPLRSLAVSPDYENDETILAGSSSGWVYWSDDNGASFSPLPKAASSAPLSASVTVAFDPEYPQNHTVYAASDTADKGIFRFVIGASTAWESIDGNLPTGAKINQVTLADDGTLYAANAKADGGMERSLNPSFPPGATFETVTRGLPEGATLYGIWASDHTLWTVDTTNVRLLTFTDTLTEPVTPVTPENNSSRLGSVIDHTVKNISLDWTTLEGATGYQWQLDYDNDFSSLPDGFEASTKSSSAYLPALEPDVTYYWRVRASNPVVSPWSEKQTFTTTLDTQIISLNLAYPASGDIAVSVKPVFQWAAVAGANAYELLVSADSNFTNPSIIKTGDYALSDTAWQADLSLEYATTYFWKVRAVSARSASAWSAAAAFVTEAPPTTPEQATYSNPPINTEQNSPSYVPIFITPSATTSPTPPAPTVIELPDIPDWLSFTIIALLGAILLLLLIILLLVIRIAKP